MAFLPSHSKVFSLVAWFFVAKIARSQREAATPILFEIVEGGTFQCVDPGARCSYVASDYSDVTKTDGQESISDQENIWAAMNPARDRLTVGACVTGSCYTVCNANCTCTTPSNEACTVEISRAPVTPPPTASPVAQVCAQQLNTKFCNQLMPQIRAGNRFDCYNFCGGQFISTCSFGPNGQCGRLWCGNRGEGKNDLVLGCTDTDRLFSAPPSPAPFAPFCAIQSNNEFCSDLMVEVPAGNQFDCYNFCGGRFVSSCEFGPTALCGSVSCDDSGEGRDGIVLGCTDADRPSSSTKVQVKVLVAIVSVFACVWQLF